ncbi:MAG: deoxyguanosinetriphosphate triphosphohydrolase, partial [Candidatus Firestonebacteria bacterium]
YPGYPGLNLTYEVLEGIDKHRTDYDNSGSKLFKSRFPTLEAQLVNLADEIAYNTHDLDDGIKSNLLKIDMLKGLEICAPIYKMFEGAKPEILRYQIVRELINKFSTDLILRTTENIRELGIKSVENARKASIAAVSFSKKLAEEKNELKAFLFANLYKHYRVVRMESKHQRILEELFKVYLDRFEHNPGKKKYSILPREIWEKAKDESKEQVVCDHIASMTDRYALEEHKKLFEASEKV